MTMEYENVIWKDVIGYEGLYKVSNNGDIMSMKKYNRKEPTILKLRKKRGYYQIALSKKGKKKWYAVHRLVAQAFIPNINNYPCVNHKDENKLNNRVENLEWCTARYNNMYGTRIDRVKEKTSKKILQYSLDGKFIKEYPSLSSIKKEMKVSLGNIVSCCKGKYSKAYGYVWKYKEVVNNASGV